MSLNEHEGIDDVTELSNTPSGLNVLHAIDAIEAIFDSDPRILQHETIPVERRHDGLWDLEQKLQPKIPKTADFSGIYEPEVYPEGDIQKLYTSRTGKKVYEIQSGDLTVGDIFELFFRITHNGEPRVVSLVVHITMLNKTGLYGAVYGRPLYTGKKDVFCKKTKDQAKIPFPMYSRRSEVLRGARNFSATFCRWIKTAQIMEQDIEYIVIRKPQLIEKTVSKVKGLIRKIKGLLAKII